MDWFGFGLVLKPLTALPESYVTDFILALHIRGTKCAN
jgi:hypothetical protein